MKKKIAAIVYIVVVLAVCLVPFAGMTAFRTDETTENKTLAEFPELFPDGTWNRNFLSDLGTYFEDHFAFREALVDADAEIQSRIFRVSNVDTVITGENGWLYYSSTLDDYLGQNLMSERELFAAAHNLALMQQAVEQEGVVFAVAVPPNKNSLYGENMPYYDSVKVSEEKNIDGLTARLEEEGVTCVDLFALFEGQEETLYLKRDSHWNGKGALLAYREMMDTLQIPYDPLETVTAVRTKTEIGDLNTMIYPRTAEPEWNYYYNYEETWQYVTETQSVEDAWIETENPEGEGSLLMFRDSFGNTLLPLMAGSFRQAYFSKGEPYDLTTYMEEYAPSAVIVEKVERNIRDFAQMPPLMAGMETELPAQTVEEPEEEAASEETVSLEPPSFGRSENDIRYVSLSGTLPEAETETRVYVRLSCGESEKVWEAFLVASDVSQNDYRLYLSADELEQLAADEGSEGTLQIFAGNEEKVRKEYERTVNLDEILHPDSDPEGEE